MIYIDLIFVLIEIIMAGVSFGLGHIGWGCFFSIMAVFNSLFIIFVVRRK